MKKRIFFLLPSNKSSGVWKSYLYMKSVLSKNYEIREVEINGWICAFFLRTLLRRMSSFFFSKTHGDVYIGMHFGSFLPIMILNLFFWRSNTNPIVFLHTDVVEYEKGISGVKKLIFKAINKLLAANKKVMMSKTSMLRLNDSLGGEDVDYLYSPVALEGKGRAHCSYNRFIVIGRLVPDKGVDVAIRAFHKISEIYNDVKLEIYGDGPSKQKLEDYAKKLCLEDKVFFKGYVSNVDKILFDGGCLISCSRIEGLSLVCCEAVTLGVPVIASDCWSGPKEILYPDANLLERTSSKAEAPYGFLVPVSPYVDHYLDEISGAEIEYVDAMSSFIEEKKKITNFDHCIFLEAFGEKEFLRRFENIVSHKHS